MPHCVLDSSLISTPGFDPSRENSPSPAAPRTTTTSVNSMEPTASISRNRILNFNDGILFSLQKPRWRGGGGGGGVIPERITRCPLLFIFPHTMAEAICRERLAGRAYKRADVRVWDCPGLEPVDLLPPLPDPADCLPCLTLRSVQCSCRW